MHSYNLSPIESRILGCLIEKERVTPETYPLSLNALVAACNQATNREPVVSYDDKTVENGVNLLREKKLATVVFGAGSRVQKYRHNLLEHYELNPREVALLCVLLLRGPQTPGELRGRSERLGGLQNLEEIEACLAELVRGDSPLVRSLPARPGQKEQRFVQLFSAEQTFVEPSAPEMAAGRFGSEATPAKLLPSDVERLEGELRELKAGLQQLQEEFAAFRRQFE